MFIKNLKAIYLQMNKCRYKGSVNRPDCRKARAMGAIERALRSSSTRKTEHIFELVIGIVFGS
jgi:hypothetical protein